jgi:hypothetical protein
LIGNVDLYPILENRNTMVARKVSKTCLETDVARVRKEYLGELDGQLPAIRALS